MKNKTRQRACLVGYTCVCSLEYCMGGGGGRLSVFIETLRRHAGWFFFFFFKGRVVDFSCQFFFLLIF